MLKVKGLKLIRAKKLLTYSQLVSLKPMRTEKSCVELSSINCTGMLDIVYDNKDINLIDTQLRLDKICRKYF